ncbi:MAG: response regulator [Deltaproteobacteria bacterium]
MERKKLLIVDDAPENLRMLYQTLKNEYKLFSAANGKEALSLAESVAPDLILLDVMMPEMDGFEVCGCLKGDDALKDIPVLFLTALVEETDEVKGFKAGAVDYITKPFKPMVVKHRIATHLQLKSQRDELASKNLELEEALAKVKTLSGLLPICMECKKIRDDKGYWNQLEAYISQHSEVLFSHGLCHECATKQMLKFRAEIDSIK